MRSIQTKFITLILACVLLSSVVIGGAGVRIAHTVVDKDSAQIMNLLCSGKASDLDGLFSRIEQSVKTLAVYASEQLESLERLKTDADYMEAYTSQLRSVAVNAADNTEGALAVYVRFNPEFAPPTSGLFWSRTTRRGSFQELPPTDFSTYSPNDTEHVGWYYIPVNNGVATWMAPYYNQNIGVEMVSYVIPIYRDGETVGVVGMDIDFSVIEDAVNNIQVYDTGYAFLVDAQGMVVCHREIPLGTPMESVDKSLAPLVRELQNGTTGSSLFTYDWRNQEKELAFRTLRNSMHLAVTAPVTEIDAADRRAFRRPDGTVYAPSYPAPERAHRGGEKNRRGGLQRHHQQSDQRRGGHPSGQLSKDGGQPAEVHCLYQRAGLPGPLDRGKK